MFEQVAAKVSNQCQLWRGYWQILYQTGCTLPPEPILAEYGMGGLRSEAEEGETSQVEGQKFDQSWGPDRRAQGSPPISLHDCFDEVVLK